MAAIHIERIKNAVRKLFNGQIDLSDYHSRPNGERDIVFLSRALAAYTLTLIDLIEPAAAAKCLTDGFDDNGIDLVSFNSQEGILYIGQSKWIENGKGSVSSSDTKKFADGVRDLLSLRLERFNDRLRQHEPLLKKALYSTDVRFVLFLSYTGTQELSKHAQRDMDDLVEETNDPVELMTLETFAQERIYNGIAGHAQKYSANIEVMLREWGHVEEPYPAYYGQVDASSIAEWWRNHGRSLFARNLRHFKGSTDVNDALATTLKVSPNHFWYFNNGITILCTRIAKKALGGASRDTGIFECDGVSVVNGAQTVGMIGAVNETNRNDVDNARVLVRLISLEECPEGFDKDVTRATNHQNRIESRDFAALDPNQQRLASELFLDGKQYAFKSGDPSPKEDEGCTIGDATVALACADDDVALAVQSKREIGKLWESIDAPPYTTLFNDHTNAVVLWRAVEIMRSVEKRLKHLSESKKPRADMLAVHGNRVVLHRVYHHPDVKRFRDPSVELSTITSNIPEVVDRLFNVLANLLEQEYPNAYLASLFKNLSKCRDVNDVMARGIDDSTDAGDDVSRLTQHTRFDSVNE